MKHLLQPMFQNVFKNKVLENITLAIVCIMLLFKEDVCATSVNISRDKYLICHINELITNFNKIIDEYPIPTNKRDGTLEWLKKIRFFLYNTSKYSIGFMDLILEDSIIKTEKILRRKNKSLIEWINCLENEIYLIYSLMFNCFIKTNFITKMKYKINSIMNFNKAGVYLEKCCICIYTLNNFEICVLGCGHIFHKKCIMVWIFDEENPHNTCPLCCRLFYEGNFDISSSQD